MLNILLSLVTLALPLKAKVPSDIAIYKNKIYIVDGLNKKLIILNKKNLKSIKTIKLEGNAFGIFIDSKGYIYLTYPNEKMISIFDKDGNEKKFIHLKYKPLDIAKLNKNIFVTLKNGHIQILDENGKIKKDIKNFSSPSYLAVDKNFVYVVDTDLGKVILLNSKGEIYYELANFGITKGKVFKPTGIAVDKNYVYVGDPVFAKVERFSKAGEYKGYFSNINNVLGIAIDKNNLYVLDSLNSKLIIRKKNEVEK